MSVFDTVSLGITIFYLLRFCYTIRTYRYALIICLATILYIASISYVITSQNNILLHSISFISMLIVVVLYVYTRKDYGIRKHLPPGSLSLTNSIHALTNEYFYQEQAQVHGNIFKYSQYYRPTICVVGIPHGTRLLKEYKDHLVASPLPFSQTIPDGFIRYMKDEKHRIYSPILCKAFPRKLVDQNKAYFQKEIQKQISSMSQLSQENSINPRKYLQEATFSCFTQVIFGITEKEEVFHRLKNIWLNMPKDYLTNSKSNQVTQAIKVLNALIHEKFSQLEKENCALYNLKSMNLKQEQIPTIYGNIIYTFLIGISNTSSLLCWVLKEMGENPEWLKKAKIDEGIVDCIVSEVLRLHQSEYIYRTITKSFSYENFSFPNHWQLRVCIRESHRDATVFEQPNVFNPQRFLDRKAPRNQYSPFGIDHHICFGYYLAKTVASVLTVELAQNSWKIEGDSKVQKSIRHWNHWEPSPKLRVVWT